MIYCILISSIIQISNICFTSDTILNTYKVVKIKTKN